MIHKIEHTVVVASKNPVKIEAALRGFEKMFPDKTFSTLSISVSSEVADQPMSDEETFAGAVNRVNNAVKKHTEADFWIGIEGGVEIYGGELTAFAWVVVRSVDGLGKARSGTFFLPHAVATLVAQGMELGEADDIVFNKSNSKQESGAIGLLTNNVVDRMQLYEQAVVLALVRFKNEALYQPMEKEVDF
ncbi:inosine/xanthosine triphosphatase [Pontibacter cellulosilyticus]|uniref:Probable inosine/xanthosine triphosphatase n=1 Tax=Pontibacter cellulosilyticus TaxID=1720253 RepID=A0A923SMI4_9BACT|nr:inosine/xanthosine triphosphatase [Pontibacter cellulosilyticus]MBC5992230.1 inosine/xanthosine triphosphatase [Pontibacter cellulosilyticus]